MSENGVSFDEFVSEFMDGSMDGSTETKKLADGFKHESKIITDRIKELAQMMSDIHDLATNKHKLYEYRQDLVQKKFFLMSLSNKFYRKYIKMRKDIHDAYKFGRKLSTSNTSIILKNEEERSMYIYNDMPEYEFKKQLIADQLDNIMDSIKSIDKLIYGIPYAISLEEYKTN